MVKVYIHCVACSAIHLTYHTAFSFPPCVLIDDTSHCSSLTHSSSITCSRDTL